MRRLTRPRTRKNPIPVTDAAILVGVGVVVGGLAYWLYTRNSSSSDQSASGAIPTGTDVAGYATTATPPSAATGGVGVFSNVTPGALGPTAVSS